MHHGFKFVQCGTVTGVPLMNNDDALNEEFARRVTQRARELGLKQADIVRATGAAKSTVNRWFAGARPQGENLRKLRKALKVSQEWLDGDSFRPTAKSEAELFSVIDNAADCESYDDISTSFVSVNNIIKLSGFPDEVLVPRDFISNVEDPRKLFACPVGNSEVSRLNRRDIAIVENRKPESGDLVLVKLPGSGAHLFFDFHIDPFEDVATFSNKSGVAHRIEMKDKDISELLHDIIEGRVVSAIVRF